MKIGIYSHSIAPSIDGVCRRFTSIMHELVRQGHEIILFTMEAAPEDLPSSTFTVLLDHMTFPQYPQKKAAKPTISTFMYILRQLKHFQPAVLHIVCDCFSQTFLLCGFLLGIPVVGSFHTDLLDLLKMHNAYDFQKRVIKWKESVDSYFLDTCATTSKSFQKKLEAQGTYCEHIILTSVDLNMFSPSKRKEALRMEMTFGDPDGFLCVYVGRVSSEKRIEIIFAAVRALKGNRAAYLAIVGDGPLAGFWSKRHGKENRIYCRPQFFDHAQLAEIYASSDLHVSASEFETLGNTVLEAFACGIPVVVPRTQGFSDTVRHNIDGFLFQPGDSDSAACFMQKLKDDARLSNSMGQEGRKAMSGRTISAVVGDLLVWYQKGQQNCQKRKFKAYVGISLLAIVVPLSVAAFFIYDLLINVVMRPFVSYNIHNVRESSQKGNGEKKVA